MSTPECCCVHPHTAPGKPHPIPPLQQISLKAAGAHCFIAHSTLLYKPEDLGSIANCPLPGGSDKGQQVSV